METVPINDPPTPAPPPPHPHGPQVVESHSVRPSATGFLHSEVSAGPTGVVAGVGISFLFQAARRSVPTVHASFIRSPLRTLGLFPPSGRGEWGAVDKTLSAGVTGPVGTSTGPGPPAQAPGPTLPLLSCHPGKNPTPTLDS